MTPNQQSAAAVEYQMPPKTIARSMVVLALFVAAMVYFTVAGHGPGIVVSAACALLAGYLLVLHLARALRRVPYAVLSSEGMRFKFGSHVAWDEIACVAVFSGTSAVSWKGFIGIELHDAEPYLARIGYNQRRVARAGIARGFGPIRLPGESFPVPLTEVIDAMRRLHPELVVNV